MIKAQNPRQRVNKSPNGKVIPAGVKSVSYCAEISPTFLS